jgi:UrcA family protein
MLKLALFAGAAAFVLAIQPVNAQENGPGYQSGPPEEVQVIAPHYRADPTRLNGPLQPVSLSSAVPYGDLDLVSREGARELHERVRDTAHGLCAQLADAYAVYQANGSSCFKTAYENGMVRANAAISSARQNYRLGEY